MITIEKMLWSFIKFSQLILQGNVWRSVWRICMWILGVKGLRSNDATATRKSLKKWICVHLVFIAIIRDYSYILTLSANVGQSSWSWIPRDHIQVQKAKYNFVVACLWRFYVLHKTRNEAFFRRSRAKREKKCTVKRDGRTRLLFSLLNLLVF